MTNIFPEGSAIVFCEGAYGTTYGKTAHGLIRRSKRYTVLNIIDSTQAGLDSGQLLDGRPNGIPVLPDLESALRCAPSSKPATHFVIGLAPDGGRLHPDHRQILFQAIEAGLHVDSGLHDFLSEDPEVAALAVKHGVIIRDVRKTPPRNKLHFFSGKIEEVRATKVAVLGTDSAVGKRTTAWMLVDGLQTSGISAELIGTGQTAWMQGARYSLILDSLVNDFVSGEIEHAVWSAWTEVNPDVIIIEGQGSLMNPAYPGGFEILAAGRPDVIVLQHAPARKDYDGFPGYPIQPIQTQIKVIELLSNKPVVALAINHENLNTEEIPKICAEIERLTGLPTIDALIEGPGRIIDVLQQKILK